MDLLFNDLSIHEQFHTLEAFREAFGRLVKMHNIAKRFGLEIQLSGGLWNTNPTPNEQIQKAIGQFPESERRAAMAWLSKGLFWDTPGKRMHSEDDLLECDSGNGQVVTDTAVGEAAFRVLQNSKCEISLISLKPSDWESQDVRIVYRQFVEQAKEQRVRIDNILDPDTLERVLENAEPPVQSWHDLREQSLLRFPRLKFAESCFTLLNSVPFAKSSADRLMELLDILNQFADATDYESGKRTDKGQQIYQKYFTGDNAWFSDSSDTEKQRFRKKLDFPHPQRSGESLFCPYHGKERHHQLRLHFSWPVPPGEPIYVVYIGPKLTKK